MSSQSTPTHRIEFADPTLTPCAWRKHYGRPTTANLVKYVEKFNDSVKPGGCNEHLSKVMPDGITGMVRLVRQSDNQVVTNYMA